MLVFHANQTHPLAAFGPGIMDRYKIGKENIKEKGEGKCDIPKTWTCNNSTY